MVENIFHDVFLIVCWYDCFLLLIVMRVNYALAPSRVMLWMWILFQPRCWLNGINLIIFTKSKWWIHKIPSAFTFQSKQTRWFQQNIEIVETKTQATLVVSTVDSCRVTIGYWSYYSLQKQEFTKSFLIPKFSRIKLSERRLNGLVI